MFQVKGRAGRPYLRAATDARRDKDWVIARWVWSKFLRSRIKFALLALVFMVIEALSIGGISYLMRPLFDDLLVAGQKNQVFWVALAMSGLFLIRGFSHFFSRTILAWQAKLARMAAQKLVMQHLYTLDQRFYQDRGPGELISRVKGDTSAVGEVLSVLLIKLGRDGTTTVVLLSVALWTDLIWTLLALIIIPLIVIPVRMLQKLIRKRSRQLLETNAALTKRLDESFHGIRTIQLNRIESYELGRFEALKRLHLRKSIQVMIAKATVPLLMNISAGVGMALVLFFGGMQIVDGTHSVGQLMSFFTALGLLVDPMRRLAVFSAMWQSKLAALERTYDLLQVQPLVRTSADKPVPISKLDDMSVEFKDVTFRYSKSTALEGVNCYFPAGKMTAIVGPSGAGKSTLLSLMTRFFDPSSGVIEVGGMDIRLLDLHRLRGLFAMVSQETALFDETIRENILLGRSNISEAQLNNALEAANVTEFLPRMAQGIESKVGPRGSGLSGGQRQRVVIARAILSDAPILLLDEATSALDSQSEALVQQSLERLAQTRTTVVIAHRLSTVRKADEIIVMDHGRIVERGNHEALLVENGLYASMCMQQFSQT